MTDARNKKYLNLVVFLHHSCSIYVFLSFKKNWEISWKDIKLLDVRPGKGITKIRAKSSWEIQIHNETGEVLAVNYRRSDFFESLHDGSWFHDNAKLGIFLPSAIIMLIMSLTGLYLFFKLLPAKLGRKKKKAKKEKITG